MKSEIKTFLLTVLFLLQTGALYAQPDLPEVSHQNLKSNLKFLADDYIEGRETATRGGKVAARFIAAELEKYGLQPIGDSYIRPFDVLFRTTSTDSKVIISGSFNSELSIIDDFIILPFGKLNKKNTNILTEVVIPGYGITAPEYEYDDYENVDVKGKSVLIFAGEPYREDDTVFFKGSEQSKYASIIGKVKKAVSEGAVSVILAIDEQLAPNWEAYQYSNQAAIVRYAADTANSRGFDIPIIGLRPGLIKDILTNEKYSYEKIKAMLDKGEPIPVITTGLTAEFLVEQQTGIRTAENVAGFIEGTDPVLKNEIITIGAHYDHIGVTKGVVNNGADDNGSGTVAVLETARLIAEQNGFKRSVAVILYTGEEKGFLGSEWFVDHYDRADDIICNLNLDMVGRGSSDTIYSIGSNRVKEEFKQLVEEVNSKSVDFVLNYSLDNPDGHDLYRNSDQYAYRELEVPVLFLFDNMYNDLHSPRDDEEKINYDKIAKTVQFIFLLAAEVSENGID